MILLNRILKLEKFLFQKPEFAFFDTHAGYGSTATKIPYFTNTRYNTVNKFGVITNDSTNGLQVTLRRNCMVGMLYSAAFNAVSYLGLSVNGTATTDIGTLTAPASITHVFNPTAGAAGLVFCVHRAFPGDIFRPHTNAGTADNTGFHRVVVAVWGGPPF